MGGLSVDNYQQDVAAMPPVKETESLTEFMPGFGVFLFRKDKHSRKRRRQFIKLGRSQKAKVVKVTYSVIEAVCRAMLPDCPMDLLDAVIAQHRGGRRNELSFGALARRHGGGVHDGADEEDEDDDGTMTLEEEEGEERERDGDRHSMGMGLTRPLPPRTEGEGPHSGRGEAAGQRERKAGEGWATYGSPQDVEAHHFGGCYNLQKLLASYPYCVPRAPPPQTHPWCGPPDEERACSDGRERPAALHHAPPGSSKEGLHRPSVMGREGELQWVREGAERGPRLSSEAGQLEEYARWPRPPTSQQSVAVYHSHSHSHSHGGRPSVQDAARHLTAAGLRGLGSPPTPQFNHLPIGRPLQLLEPYMGGKTDPASMQAMYSGLQASGSASLGSFLTLIKAAADEMVPHDRQRQQDHFGREHAEPPVGPSHPHPQRGVGPYRTPPLPSRHPGLHGAGSIGSDPCDVAPNGNGNGNGALLQHRGGQWGEGAAAQGLGLPYGRAFGLPHAGGGGHNKRPFSGEQGPGDAATSLQNLRDYMRAAAERADSGNTSGRHGTALR